METGPRGPEPDSDSAESNDHDAVKGEPRVSDEPMFAEPDLEEIDLTDPPPEDGVIIVPDE